MLSQLRTLVICCSSQESRVHPALSAGQGGGARGTELEGAGWHVHAFGVTLLRCGWSQGWAERRGRLCDQRQNQHRPRPAMQGSPRFRRDQMCTRHVSQICVCPGGGQGSLTQQLPSRHVAFSSENTVSGPLRTLGLGPARGGTEVTACSIRGTSAGGRRESPVSAP